MDSFVMELHLEEVAAFYLGDIVYDVFIVQEARLNYKISTFIIPVDTPYPHGTNTS